MTTTVGPYEMRIAVQPDDIDQLNHVNNVVYLRWVQDLAVAHWQAEAPEIDQAKLLWVVVRHEIDYKKPAFLGDEIVGRTWVGEASRLAFERHTEFTRAADGETLAKVRTVWVPLDINTGRPTAVSPEVRAYFSTAPKASKK